MTVLCAFEAAARHQSFTAAADELCLTQSAVSRQIRSLEDLLGSELFVRQRQTVGLTLAGETLASDLVERRTGRDLLGRHGDFDQHAAFTLQDADTAHTHCGAGIGALGYPAKPRRDSAAGHPRKGRP